MRPYAVVAAGMRRVEPEDDARRRNQDTCGPAFVTMRLGPAELTALRIALDAYLAEASDHHRILEELYELFTGQPIDAA
jgi:hypothetical protein